MNGEQVSQAARFIAELERDDHKVLSALRRVVLAWNRQPSEKFCVLMSAESMAGLALEASSSEALFSALVARETTYTPRTVDA